MTDVKNLELLLVEDSDDDAYFFERMLKKSGLVCSLHHVTDGAQAIEYLQNTSGLNSRSSPSLIFLDLKIPVVNGFEVLEWMRGNGLLPRIQVIVLSGSGHPDDKARAASLGAVDYLVKPVQVSDLHRFLGPLCLGNPEMGARA